MGMLCAMAPAVALIVICTVVGVPPVAAGVAGEDDPQPITAHVRQPKTATISTACTARDRLRIPVNPRSAAGARKASEIPIRDCDRPPDSYGFGAPGVVTSAIDTPTVSVPAFDNITLLGVKVQLTLAGWPEQESDTAPLNPAIDPSERLAVPG